MNEIGNECPSVFDPVAYVADMRSAGLYVELTRDGRFVCGHPEGMSADSDWVWFKWQPSRKNDPGSSLKVCHHLQNLIDANGGDPVLKPFRAMN